MKTLAILAGMTLMTACASVESSYSYTSEINTHSCTYPDCELSTVHYHVVSFDNW